LNFYLLKNRCWKRSIWERMSDMAIKNGKDYLYLIWKCTSNRRQYIVGQLTKNGQYEFQYGGEIKDAIKVGFKPLVSFEKLGNVYKCEEYDSYELLKRSGAKLPIDNLQFIDPILDFEDEFEKKFYVAGVRHYLGCEGEKCTETLLVTRGDEVFLEQEKNNQYDKNAIRVVNEQRKLLGYVPRYYAQAFNKFIEEKRIRECHVVNVEKENCCDECICVLLKINELKD